MNNEDEDNDDDMSYELGQIYLHRWIDAQDEYNKWYEAQIIEIADAKIKVHYKGWKSKFDTWIDLNSEPERARKLHLFTERPPNKGNLTEFSVDTKCDCLDSTDKWYEATIVGESENGKLVNIHYKGWDNKYNEWINKDSYRLAPLHTMTKPSNIKENNSQSSKPKSTQSAKSTSNATKSSNIKPKIIKNNKQKIIKRKQLKRTNSDHRTVSDSVNNTNITVLSDIDTDIKDDNDTDHDININKEEIEKTQQNVVQSNDKSNEISQEQHEKNEEIRQKYIHSFKPTQRDELQFSAKLLRKGYKIESMGEDGNCLFRSISHQIYGKEDFHMTLRQKCVQYLQSEYHFFCSYVAGGQDKNVFDAYCNRMNMNGVWGDNLEIQAFSEIYGRRIEIYAYDDKPMQTFNDKDNDSEMEPIRLSYHCNSHYNSIIDLDEIKRRQCLMDEDKVGQIEDEKIRLSYLRSTHANEQSLNISDIEATDLEYFRNALAESRKLFEDNKKNTTNEQFDIAIKKSLALYEKEQTENVIKQSIKEQEEREVQMAIEKSQWDYTNEFGVNTPNSNNNNNGNFDSDIAAMDAVKNITNDAVKAVIEKGYSLEQATSAYSLFEKSNFPLQEMTQKMIEWIQMVEKSQMCGF